MKIGFIFLISLLISQVLWAKIGPDDKKNSRHHTRIGLHRHLKNAGAPKVFKLVTYLKDGKTKLRLVAAHSSRSLASVAAVAPALPLSPILSSAKFSTTTEREIASSKSEGMENQSPWGSYRDTLESQEQKLANESDLDPESNPLNSIPGDD